MANIPTVPSFTSGQQLPASTMNTLSDLHRFVLGQTLTDGSRIPICVLVQTTQQTIPNTSTTPITWDTEQIDTDNMHSTTTNPTRITAQTAGWYEVSAVVPTVTAPSSGKLGVGLTLNGEMVLGSAAQTPFASQPIAVPIPGAVLYMGSGDYLELWAYQNSGSSVQLRYDTSGGACPRISVRYLMTG